MREGFMELCLFSSDLHGREKRYQKLFQAIEEEKPAAVFLGGDLFPSGLAAMANVKSVYDDFLEDVMASGFSRLLGTLGSRYPAVFLILGNDDGRFEESRVEEYEQDSLWSYVHNKRVSWREYTIYGYAYVPPTPFLLKDWERYDVSTYADPGCISPEEGWHSVPVPGGILKRATIQDDLQQLTDTHDLSRAIFLFHTPPYQTGLDRAALDGKKIDHVEVDVHVGSIAVRRFIESRQPLLTLHGHIHESARITGTWKERIGQTYAFSAAHSGEELALIKFDLQNLDAATRELLR
jgi:Icc-related predicted phosphoesterase